MSYHLPDAWTALEEAANNVKSGRNNLGELLDNIDADVILRLIAAARAGDAARERVKELEERIAELEDNWDSRLDDE